MQIDLKRGFSFGLFMIIFICGFIFVNQTKGQEEIKKSELATQRVSKSIRIVIATSGPVKFKAHWLNNPPRLQLKFRSKNVLSNIDREVIVNQGVIKKITSDYFIMGKKKSLKSLTFEFIGKLPYKIWQEDDTIILEIQKPGELAGLFASSREIFTVSEVDRPIIKRLEAMDMALRQVAERQTALEVSESEVSAAEISKVTKGEIDESKMETILPKAGISPIISPPKARKSLMGILLWFTGLVLISGLGFLAWSRFKSSRDRKFNKLGAELQEKDKRLEQEEIIRKAMTKASLEKEKELQQLKNSFESLKDELVKKKLVKRQLSPEEKERPWISGKSQERRASPHLSLTKDYNKTVILRIESPNILESIKCFAKNISSEGLCFEITRDFNEKEPLNFKLFFYGDQVPMIKIQAHIVWKKKEGSINYYGVNIDSIDEKDKLELERYIDTKLGKAAISEV